MIFLRRAVGPVRFIRTLSTGMTSIAAVISLRLRSRKGLCRSYAISRARSDEPCDEGRSEHGIKM